MKNRSGASPSLLDRQNRSVRKQAPNDSSTRQFLVGAIICAVFVIGSLLDGSTCRRRLPNEGEKPLPDSKKTELRREKAFEDDWRQRAAAVKIQALQQHEEGVRGLEKYAPKNAPVESEWFSKAERAEWMKDTTSMAHQQRNDFLKEQQLSEEEARQRLADEHQLKREQQEAASRRKSIADAAAAVAVKRRNDAAYERTLEETRIANAETKEMKLRNEREKAAKVEKTRNEEKSDKEMGAKGTQSTKPSLGSLRVAFPVGEFTTITSSGHATASDGTGTQSDCKIMVHLEKANGTYSTKAANITAAFTQGNARATSKAKRPVTFNCPNGWSIRRDNATFKTFGPRTKSGKLRKRATQAQWTLFNEGDHEVLTQTVTLDHSVGLLAGRNLPRWIAN